MWYVLVCKELVDVGKLHVVIVALNELGHLLLEEGVHLSLLLDSFRIHFRTGWESYDDDTHVIPAALKSQQSHVSLSLPPSLSGHLVQAGVNDLIADGLQVVMDFHPVDDEVADVLIAHNIPHTVTS